MPSRTCLGSTALHYKRMGSVFILINIFNISQYYCFYYIYDQMNAPMLGIKDYFQKT